MNDTVKIREPARVYEDHPFANCWDLLEGQAFEDFATDIAAYGLRVPIVLYEDRILDGRNRDRACREAGVEPRYEIAPVDNDEDAIALVASLNNHRRHDSLEKRAFAAAALANLRHGGARKSENANIKISTEILKNEETHVVTIEKAAEMMNVSVGSVRRAKAVIKHGPDLVDAVKTGKQSLYDAANKALAVKKAEKVAKKKATMTAMTAAASPSAPVRGRPNVIIIPPNPNKRVLTRQDVDPEFVGTELEFVRKYGHVWIETAQERATTRFRDWSIMIHGFAKLAKTHTTEVDLNWLRSPRPEDIRRMREALDVLRPTIAKAEAMLARAEKK